MVTKKLTAIWYLVTSGYSLKGKIRLVIRMEVFLSELKQNLNDTATARGELHTLQALRAVTEEQIENGRH
jgi:hypothetical protein